MKKRGQLTLYIILGIVILAIFIILFSMRYQTLEQDFESEMNSIIVPEQIKPAKDYFDVCLKRVTVEGINLIAAQGGYINIPEEKYKRTITDDFSNVLNLYSVYDVAYWFYESSNGIKETQVPTKEKMEEELGSYIDNNFNDCYYFAKSFEDDGFDINYPESIMTEVIINKNNVQVKLNSDLRISLKDVTSDINKLMIISDSKLGELYDLAVRVMEKENEDLFLEEKTIDFMSVYEEIPFSTTEFSCERKVWRKGDVLRDFKGITNTNIGAIRLKDPASSAYIKTNKDYFEIDLIKPNYITETFSYSTDFPMYMDVSPMKGELLVGDALTQQTPEISKFLNLFFCLNNYHFIYDIKYPVLISLTDDVTGLNFQYATQVIIDNNKPREYEGPIYNAQESNDFTDKLCGNKVNPIEITAYDKASFLELGDASILYKCFTSTCYIGETDKDGKLNANFPPCLNGVVIAQKEGYEMGVEFLSTNTDKETSVLMDKYHTLDLDIKEVQLGDGFTSSVNDKQAVVQLENLDNGYITMVTGDEKKIKLTNGNYKITSYLMTETDTEIELKSDSQISCVEVPRSGILGLFSSTEKCFESEFDGGTLTDVMVGAAEYEWYADVTGKRAITIYIPYEMTPRTQTEMLEVFNNIGLNKDNPNFLYPELQ